MIDGIIEFSAWSGCYRLILRGAPQAEFVSCDDGTEPGYHRVFLEQLAEYIDLGRPDYRSAELSLAALRLVDSAYRSHDDRDWKPGIPAPQD